MWDLRLKLSPASRTLAECDHFDPNNTEFTISLLDCRYVAGDGELYAKLHDKVIPKLPITVMAQATVTLAVGGKQPPHSWRQDVKKLRERWSQFKQKEIQDLNHRLGESGQSPIATE